MKDFIKKNKLLYRSARFLKQCIFFLYGIIIFLFSLIEVPLFFLLHPRIFKNKELYVFWVWSLGHQVLGLDWAARLYSSNRISLLYISHPGMNDYLPLCFEHEMDVFVFRGVLPTGKSHLNHIRYAMLRCVVLFASALFPRFHVPERESVYRTVSVAKGKFWYGDECKASLEEFVDYSGYIHLRENNIGQTLKLPEPLDRRCRDEITRSHPDFFKKPFVTILLRSKGNIEDFETVVRSSGPQENYAPAVRLLIQEGYHVTGTGETDHKVFSNIPGYFPLSGVNLPPALLNLFLIMKCSLFICQQSGTHVLADSCGVPVLICDAFPYRLGTFSREDVVLFKHFRERATGRRLSYAEVFQNHQDLAYGYHFAQKGIDIEPNSEEEILEAARESILRIQGKLRLTDEEKLLEQRFRSLYSPGMTIAIQGNRPSIHMLRQCKNELL